MLLSAVWTENLQKVSSTFKMLCFSFLFHLFMMQEITQGKVSRLWTYKLASKVTWSLFSTQLCHAHIVEVLQFDIISMSLFWDCISRMHIHIGKPHLSSVGGVWAWTPSSIHPLSVKVWSARICCCRNAVIAGEYNALIRWRPVFPGDLGIRSKLSLIVVSHTT